MSDIEWGHELDGWQARLDAAMDEAEARHHGEDGGRHHRTGNLTGAEALLRTLAEADYLRDYEDEI